MIFITFTNGQYQISVNPSKVLFVTKVSDLRSEIVFGPQHFIQVTVPSKRSPASWSAH